MVLYGTFDGRKFFDCQLLFYIRNHMNNEVKTILTRDQNPQNLVDSTGKMLLHYAVMSKNEQIVKYLIDKGSDVNAQDIVGNTPLTLAVNELDSATVQLLLDANANMFARAFCSCSPLQMVFAYPIAGSMHDIMMKFLCTLQKVCKSNAYEIAKKLIEAECPFPRTVCFGPIEVMKSMLQQGCSIESRDLQYGGCTALQMAVATVNLEAVHFLVNHGADVNAEDNCGSSVLHYYEHEKPETHEKLEILRILISRGVTFDLADDKSSKLVSKLLSYGGLKTVKIILQSEIDLRTRCKDHNGDVKPLFFALAVNNQNVIEEVRGKVSDFNQRDSYGRTALFYAACLGNSDCVKFLLEHGADTNLIDCTGRTVLLRVIAEWAKEDTLPKNCIDCIQYLLQYNANVQFVTNYGRTAFHTLLQYPKNQLTTSILQHLAMKEILGYPLHALISQQIAAHSSFIAQYCAQKKTLGKMRMSVLHGPITFFDLLTVSKEKIISYVRNKEVFLRMIGFLDHLATRFADINPYSYIPNLLNKRLCAAIQTTILREKAIRVLLRIERLNDDPYVIHTLIQYFNDYDLRSIAQV